MHNNYKNVVAVIGPQVQAIWLRLYPCDARPGAIEQIMDHIVNKGYNQVYVETFYDGQVLLPSSNNPTVWPSVVRHTGKEKVDLLTQAIEKGPTTRFKSLCMDVYNQFWLYI